jgi:hypothetical protein
MNRPLLRLLPRGAWAFLGAALVLAACDSDRDDDRYYDYGPRTADCSRQTSCGTCTPVLGCGWCYSAGGGGECVSGPERCSGSTFGWTWEPSGCRTPPDASVISDGGAAPDASDATAD